QSRDGSYSVSGAVGPRGSGGVVRAADVARLLERGEHRVRHGGEGAPHVGGASVGGERGADRGVGRRGGWGNRSRGGWIDLAVGRRRGDVEARGGAGGAGGAGSPGVGA